jgi:hypothetical protein
MHIYIYTYIIYTYNQKPVPLCVGLEDLVGGLAGAEVLRLLDFQRYRLALHLEPVVRLQLV